MRPTTRTTRTSTAHTAAHTAARLVVALASLLALPACDAIVGAECAPGYTLCDGVCVDVEGDEAHCGGCGIACEPGVLCIESTCRADFDGGPDFDAGVDAGRDGGHVDGGVPDAGDAGDASDLDAGDLDADLDAGDVDADLDASDLDASDLDAGDVDAGDLDAGTGELDAGDVDAGGAGELDAGPGMDAFLELPDAFVELPDAFVELPDAFAPDAACGASETMCGGGCVDTANDPDHCGGCFVTCASGLCAGSSCVGAIGGDLVVIGHDYETRRAGMARLVGNAVFLAAGSTVRLLSYAGTSTAAARANVAASIAGVGASSGRGFVETPLTATDTASVELALASADAFLVYAQPGTDDATLDALGAAWSAPLAGFLAAGNVVIVLDAPSSVNTGTYRLLDGAGLFAATSRATVTTGSTVVVRAASDPVARLVPSSYRAEANTVVFDTSETVVVTGTAAGAVVVHRVVLP